jgi:hypothetical protein
VHLVEEHRLANTSEAGQDNPAFAQSVCDARAQGVQGFELPDAANKLGRAAAGAWAVRVLLGKRVANDSC